MKYTTLPNTAIKISKICLGTMTWGEQNNEAEGHTQLDYAIENGINFIDTAEMYSIPGRQETQGSTEKIIGSWFAKNKNRDTVILGSKITGPSPTFSFLRDKLDFSKKSLEEAIDNSLKRLQTDYLDLYQIHWPERNTNFFGKRDYSHDENEKWQDNFAEVLDNLESFVKKGKIRHLGVSNETPYGVSRFLEESRKGKSKICTVQNPYSLLNRKDEIGLSEILLRENVGYLPYSPLGFGQLTGKYLEDTKPENARVTLFPQYGRYHNENSFEATRRYNEIAKKYDLSLTQMALAFIIQKDFVTAPIIGATSLEQLTENIGSINVHLSEDILMEIDAVHNDIPNPAP